MRTQAAGCDRFGTSQVASEPRAVASASRQASLASSPLIRARQTVSSLSFRNSALFHSHHCHQPSSLSMASPPGVGTDAPPVDAPGDAGLGAFGTPEPPEPSEPPAPVAPAVPVGPPVLGEPFTVSPGPRYVPPAGLGSSSSTYPPEQPGP